MASSSGTSSSAHCDLPLFTPILGQTAITDEFFVQLEQPEATDGQTTPLSIGGSDSDPDYKMQEGSDSLTQFSIPSLRASLQVGALANQGDCRHSPPPPPSVGGSLSVVISNHEGLPIGRWNPEHDYTSADDLEIFLQADIATFQQTLADAEMTIRQREISLDFFHRIFSSLRNNDLAYIAVRERLDEAIQWVKEYERQEETRKKIASSDVQDATAPQATVVNEYTALFAALSGNELDGSLDTCNTNTTRADGPSTLGLMADPSTPLPICPTVTTDLSNGVTNLLAETPSSATSSNALFADMDIAGSTSHADTSLHERLAAMEDELKANRNELRILRTKLNSSLKTTVRQVGSIKHEVEQERRARKRVKWKDRGADAKVKVEEGNESGAAQTHSEKGKEKESASIVIVDDEDESQTYDESLVERDRQRPAWATASSS